MRRKKLGNGKLSNLYSGIHVVFASLFNDTFVCISVMYTIQNIGIDVQSLEYFFLIFCMGLCLTGFSLSF